MDNSTIVTLTREHDKVCILELLLKGDTELEQVVSQYIDLCIDNKPKTECFRKIKDKINNIITLAKIIQLCTSIAYDKPIKLTIQVNDSTSNIIKYLNDPYPPLFD